MASGKPDWNRIVTVQGKYNDEWIPMKVDSTGQLYIAITGQQINVTQLDDDRNIMGDDGGEKRYIAVDANGVMLSRMKGLYDGGLYDIAIDINGVMLSRMQGIYSGSAKDVTLDTNGNIISVIKGDDSGTLRTVYVDGTGKMVTRIQGATGGDLIVYVLDDCGDSDPISNWAGAIDALDPVISTTFVREGSKSMELGVDASLNGLDYATWVNQQTKGDLTGLNNDKVKIWVWISTLDYLVATGTALKYGIGSGIGDFYYFNFTKAQLSIGWNELECDLSNPDGSTGSPDWSVIDIQFFDIYEIISNTEDFYIVVDSIVIVRDNPSPGTMKDLNTDANGFLLTKMVGSFGDYLKALTCDRYGNLRVNLTQADHSPLVTGRSRGSMQNTYLARTHPGIEEYTMCDIKGPGMVNSFGVLHSATGDHSNCKPEVVLDGVALEELTFDGLKKYNFTHPDATIPFLLLCDDTTHKYSVGIKAGLYFQTQLKFILNERVGAATTQIRATYTLL